MNPHPRRILTPSAPRKRKEMEVLRVVKPAARFPPPPAKPAFSAVAAAALPIPSNLVVAGYMAHEYLTKGTLLGQRWDPGRAEAVPVSGRRSGRGQEAEPSPNGSPAKERYAELARLLKSDGAHIPGIVNPAQLAEWCEGDVRWQARTT